MDPPRPPPNIGHDLGSKQLHNEKLVITGLFNAAAGNKDHGHKMIESFAPFLASIMTRSITMDAIIPPHPLPAHIQFKEPSKPFHAPPNIPSVRPSIANDFDKTACLQPEGDGTFRRNGFEPIANEEEPGSTIAKTASVQGSVESSLAEFTANCSHK